MIRTLVIVEVPFYREGLQELLSRSGEIEVVGAVSDPEEAVNAVSRALPHLVLLDAGAADACDTLTRLSRLASAPKVVALAVSETPDDILHWAEAGIAGYVPRTASSAELIRTLKDVAGGELRCSARIAATLLRRLGALAARGQPRCVLNALSEREKEVLSLIAEGMSNKVIAARLRIRPATAKNHVHNILQKLNLRGRVQAASILSRTRSLATGPPLAPR